MHWTDFIPFRKSSPIQAQQAEIQAWTEGATDPASLTIYDYATADGDEFMSYQSIVLNLVRRYNGISYLGRELTKSCIDTRVTWIAGNGANVSSEGEKENEFLEKFIRHNKLDGIGFRNAVTDSELEGKALAIHEWNEAQRAVEIKFMSWYDQMYTVETDPEDYRVVTGVTYGKNKDKELSADEFVYRNFTGSRRFLNDSPPRTGLVLFSIDSVSSALRDLRKINRKFGAAFPFFETQNNEDAKNMMKTITGTKWKIGNTLAGVAKAYYMEPSGSGLDSIIKEILMHFRLISNVTGIPVYFLAPDLMSNRATAQELLEMVNAATMSERENWKDFLTELCREAMKLHTKQTGEILDYDLVDVTIPQVTLNQVQQLVDVYLPLQQAGIISKKTLLEKVPDIDPELEHERLEEENETTESNRDPIEQMRQEMEDQDDSRTVS